MFSKKYLFSIVVASVFAVSTSANATDDEHHEHHEHHEHQEHHEHHGEKDHQKHGCNMMSKMDVDNDGNISLKEFMSHHRDMFDKADTNNDRLIDEDEMKAMMKHMHGGKHKHDDHGHEH